MKQQQKRGTMSTSQTRRRREGIPRLYSRHKYMSVVSGMDDFQLGGLSKNEEDGTKIIFCEFGVKVTHVQAVGTLVQGATGSFTVTPGISTKAESFVRLLSPKNKTANTLHAQRKSMQTHTFGPRDFSRPRRVSPRWECLQ